MSTENLPNRRTIIIEYDSGISARLRTTDGQPCTVEDIALIEAGLHNHYVVTEPGYRETENPEPGYVYLLSGPDYQKIGKSRGPSSRHRNLGVLMPWKIEMQHYIETDYMSNLEDYWHYRFHTKRQNGEWFKLSEQDISFFCSFQKLSLSRSDMVLAVTRLYTVNIIKVAVRDTGLEPTFSAMLSLEEEAGPFVRNEIRLARHNMALSSHLIFRWWPAAVEWDSTDG